MSKPKNDKIYSKSSRCWNHDFSFDLCLPSWILHYLPNFALNVQIRRYICSYTVRRRSLTDPRHLHINTGLCTQIGTGWWNVNEPGQRNHGTIMEAMKATFPTARCMNNFFVYRKIWCYLIKPIILSLLFLLESYKRLSFLPLIIFPMYTLNSFWKETELKYIWLILFFPSPSM